MATSKGKLAGCEDLMHCWHVKNSTTDGLGQKGYDTEFCCFCGVVRRRKWQYVKDPNHGSYADLLIRRDVGEGQ